MYTKYVLGFATNAQGDVLMIEKKRPEWQAGKFNGIGGKIKPHGESSADAMVREFWEETGISSNIFDWRYFGQIKGNNYEVHLYHTSRLNLANAVSATDEEIKVMYIYDVIANMSGRMVVPAPTLLTVALDPQSPEITLEY